MKSNEDLSVSVVVPFYNRSRFLKRLLDSVAVQTLSADKIYIIDNGSSLEETLSAWHIITEHNLLNKCVFTSSLSKGNANFARNLGYELAETTYVAFLDSDDWWEKKHLIDSVNCLKSTNKVAAYSAAILHSNRGSTISYSIDVNDLNDPFSLLLGGYIAQTSSYVIKKSLLSKRIIWDESLRRHQDYDYFSEIFYNSPGWCYCSQPNVNVDWNQGGTKNRDIDFESLVYFFEKWKSKIPNNLKKTYLLSMLYLSYKANCSANIKEYYFEAIKHYNYFNDPQYKLKTHRFSLLAYKYLVTFADKMGLKRIINMLIRS